MKSEIKKWVILLRSMIYLKISDYAIQQSKKCEYIARYYLYKYDEIHREK